MNVDEFLIFVEKDSTHPYELIDGYPCLMTGGSPDHSIIGANINRILGEHLRKRPCIVYNSDVYVALNDNENSPCPDASVSCDRRDRHAKKVIRYPCLIVEVLSPGTKALDKGIKLDLYQSISSVQEILYIDTQVMRVQLYRREADGWFMRNFMQDDRVELASIQLQIPVSEMYEKTTFDDTFVEEDSLE